MLELRVRTPKAVLVLSLARPLPTVSPFTLISSVVVAPPLTVSPVAPVPPPIVEDAKTPIPTVVVGDSREPLYAQLDTPSAPPVALSVFPLHERLVPAVMREEGVV